MNLVKYIDAKIEFNTFIKYFQENTHTFSLVLRVRSRFDFLLIACIILFTTNTHSYTW